MKYAISELEGQLESVLDKFCFYVEAGNATGAKKASDIADDFALALSVLRERSSFLPGPQSLVGVGPRKH